MGFNHHEIKTQRTQLYAKYIYDADFSDFPEEAVQRAKQILIQTIGAALYTRNSVTVSKAYALAEGANGGGAASSSGVWGHRGLFSAENAAMVNGVAANISNWEQNPYGMPACAAVPTAWAVAEAKHRSGRELLTAIILGFEIYERIAAAVQPTNSERSQKGYGRASWQLFAALVPALKLMGLNPLQINKGLSMGTVCSVIPASHYDTDGADTLPFEYGFRNQNAVTLVCCALQGTENLEDAFDDPSAYWMHFTDTERPDEYTRELGKTYRILSAVRQQEQEEVRKIFSESADGLFSADKQGEILDALFGIESCEDISVVGKMLLL